MINCKHCGQELRVLCPDCQRSVMIVANKKGQHVYLTHDRVHCMGSHLEWKTCPRSEKEYTDPV